MRATPTRFFVLDTSILIDQWRTSRFAEAIRHLGGTIRHSVVAIAELSGGARDRKDLRAIEDLTRHSVVLTPTRTIWRRSGKILARLAARHPRDPEVLRRRRCDLLVALTARGADAAVITTDRAHFELLRTEVPFSLVVWSVRSPGPPLAPAVRDRTLRPAGHPGGRP